MVNWVLLRWIIAHKGYDDNEKADCLAKKALITWTLLSAQVLLPIPKVSYVKKNPDYTANTFSALDSICSRLHQKGEVIMCGDANVRTGKLSDYILLL